MLIDIYVKPNIVENIMIGVDCSHDEIKFYTAIFNEFFDVFAWSYEEMLGNYRWIVEHEIPIYAHDNPIL